MSSLCPSLGTTLGADQLVEMSKLLEIEAKNSFSTWVGEQMSAFASSLARVTSDAPLTVLPAWDKVTIEETGDSGQQVLLKRNRLKKICSDHFKMYQLLNLGGQCYPDPSLPLLAAPLCPPLPLLQIARSQRLLLPPNHPACR